MSWSDLADVNPADVDHLLAFLAEYHLPYDDKRVDGKDPSLSDIVDKSLEVRQRSLCL